MRLVSFFHSARKVEQFRMTCIPSRWDWAEDGENSFSTFIPDALVYGGLWNGGYIEIRLVWRLAEGAVVDAFIDDGAFFALHDWLAERPEVVSFEPGEDEGRIPDEDRELFRSLFLGELAAL